MITIHKGEKQIFKLGIWSLCYFFPLFPLIFRLLILSKEWALGIFCVAFNAFHYIDFSSLFVFVQASKIYPQKMLAIVVILGFFL